jgi:hypothetical protein
MQEKKCRADWNCVNGEFLETNKPTNCFSRELVVSQTITLASGIDLGQGINIRHGKFGKKNKYRALNTRPGK